MPSRSVIAAGLFIIGSGPIIAQDFKQQQAALAEIRATAKDICTSIPLKGESQNTELTGDAKAKLAGVVGKVVDLGISGAAKYQSESWEGVLQKDVAEAVKDGQNCRISVFNTLVDRMIPKSSSENIKPSIPVRFNKPSGYFTKQGKDWIEFPAYAPGQNFVFQEVSYDKNYVYIADNSRTKPGDPSNGMIVRLPLQGGSAQWSYQNPMVWTELTVVTPVN